MLHLMALWMKSWLKLSVVTRRSRRQMLELLVAAPSPAAASPTSFVTGTGGMGPRPTTAMPPRSNCGVRKTR